MCARCDDGWMEYYVNGEYITADFCDCNEGHALKAEMGKMWNELELHDANLEDNDMKIIERIGCPNCGHEIDIVVENNEVLTIGGCVGCDYMPMIEEVNEVLETESYRGIDEMAIVSEYY